MPRRRTAAAPRLEWIDWLLMAAAVAALVWPIVDFGAFVYRAADPLPIDVVLGTIAIGVILEATRRSVGWILPATALAFIAYGRMVLKPI